MGISIGGMDLANTALDTQLRLGTLEKMLEHLLTRVDPGVISQQDIDRYRHQTLLELQKKYPEMGIQEVRKN